MKNRSLFLRSLEAGKSKIKALTDLVSAHRWLVSLCPVCSMRVLSGVSLVRALVSSWGLHPHDLIISQRPHLQIPSQWGFGFNIWITEGYKNSVYSNLSVKILLKSLGSWIHKQVNHYILFIVLVEWFTDNMKTFYYLISFTFCKRRVTIISIL